jgi:hypothetical protein
MARRISLPHPPPKKETKMTALAASGGMLASAPLLGLALVAAFLVVRWLKQTVLRGAAPPTLEGVPLVGGVVKFARVRGGKAERKGGGGAWISPSDRAHRAAVEEVVRHLVLGAPCGECGRPGREDACESASEPSARRPDASRERGAAALLCAPARWCGRPNAPSAPPPGW